jgi:hypothetical protein
LEVRVVRARIIRLTAIVAVALPVIMVAWTVVAIFSPDVGLHDGVGG